MTPRSGGPVPRTPQSPRQQAGASLGDRGELVVVAALEQADVERHGVRPGAGDDAERVVPGAAVHDRVAGGSGGGPPGRGLRGSSPGAAAAARTWCRRSRSTSSSGARTRDRPLAVGTEPLATAGSAGSSNCTASVAWGRRLATSATCAAAPSASEAARSATRPGSASAGFSERGCSIVAASVHGPASWSFTSPSYPWRVSSIASRSAESMARARRRSRPGCSAMRQPRGVDVDGYVDQQRRGTAGEVGTGAAAGELGEVREVRQLAGDDPRRLHRVGARHRPDPGRGARHPRKALVSHVTELIGGAGVVPRKPAERLAGRGAKVADAPRASAVPGSFRRTRGPPSPAPPPEWRQALGSSAGADD